MCNGSEVSQDVARAYMCHYIQGVNDCVNMVLMMGEHGTPWDEIHKKLVDYHVKINRFQGKTLASTLQEFL